MSLNNDIVVVNIETIKDPDLPQALLPEPITRESIKPDGRLKDSAKIAEDIERKFLAAQVSQEEEIQKMSLHPLSSKVICISTKRGDGDIFTDSGDDESKLAEHFNRIFADPATLVTFNGKSFDVPHITIACERNNIPIHLSYRTLIKKYDIDRHIDLYEILSGFGNERKGKLSDWCIRFGIEPPFGDGSLVAEWYQKEQWDNIAHHCSDNVDRTAKLLERIGDMI